MRGIKEFCVAYKKKLVNDKDIKENKVDFFHDYRERISFSVSVSSRAPTDGLTIGPTTFPLFTLDSEDIEYLYKKYAPRAEAEMLLEIEKIKNDYKGLL